MKTLPEAILSYAFGAPEGQVFSPKDFLHLGNRTAVDKALSRLSGEGSLFRVDRGAYVAPIRKKSCHQPLLVGKVVESLAGLSGEHVAPDGAASAHSLGLTTDIDIKFGYVTTGRSRTLVLGDIEIVLQHAPSWMLTLGKGQAGAAVRAMAWLGPNSIESALVRIRSSLSSTEWLKLVTCRAALPSWMARAIGEAISEDVLCLPSRSRAPKKTSFKSEFSGAKHSILEVVLPGQTIGGE